MKKSRFTNEQIAFGLRQVESDTPIEEACRKLGVSQQTFSSSAHQKSRLQTKSEDGYMRFRQQPTFTPCGTIIGPENLNHRVRNGIGCMQSGMVTGKFSLSIGRRSKRLFQYGSD